MDSAKPIVLKTTLSRWMPIVVWTVCFLLAANFVWVGHAVQLLAYLPWLALVSWATYVLSWRPCLRVGTDRLDMLNLLRDRIIPFDAVTDIRVTHSVIVRTADAAYTCWGAPGLERFGPKLGDTGSPWRNSSLGGRSEGKAGSRNPGTAGVRAGSVTGTGPSVGSKTVLDSAWRNWELRHPDGGSQRVITRWNRPVLISGGLVLLACLVQVALGSP